MRARQDVYALRIARRPLGRRLNERLRHARDGLRPAVLECILEVWRRDVDKRQLRELGPVLADERDIAVHVVALDLGDAGGTDPDHRRLGAVRDGDNGLLDILVTAKHGRHFAHGRGLHRDRFAEMAHE